ncbi:pseudouridylate synthase TRUB2, mitochondrial isoform X1 [Drosophila suzukii]|uniref:Pseudouridylate synthase TRUB2, mitochondrial isoform X1 n=1 Tax=Drosophila suzukii TaxID=28584 RepID=A0ABM4TLX7_DROSZ
MALTKVYNAATAFKNLGGVLNVYKPAGMKVKHVRNAILNNICKGLNKMEQREPGKLREGRFLGTGTAADPVLHNIAFQTDQSDHVLSAGPRYLPRDLSCSTVSSLGDHTSGVLLFGINRGTGQSSSIRKSRPVRVYHITGRLGSATENHLPDSRVTMRANHRHVSADRISGLAASIQASHQRKMFELCGVDLQTQEAYELACKGLLRPADESQPVVYGIRLVHFERPHFTLELHSINETQEYLVALVHDLALELRTAAHCSQLRCVRHAHFDVRDSLLRNSWHLPGIIKNLRHQRDILRAHNQQHRVELKAIH